MDYEGHLLIGAIVSVLMVGFLFYAKADISIFEYLVFIPIWFTYSQLPDIDTQASKIRWILTIVFLIVALYFVAANQKLLAGLSIGALLFVWMMKYVSGFGHRGVMHKHYVGAILALPLLMFSYFHLLVGIANYSSHLVADWVTS